MAFNIDPLSFTIADHIIFALLAFVLPLIAIWSVKPQARKIPSQTRAKIRLYWANSMLLWIWAIAVVVDWLVTGRSFGQLGFTLPDPTHSVEWIVITMFFVLLYMFDGFLSWVEDTDSPAMALLPANKKELLHFSTVVSLSAAVCEEVVFRGFLIVYLITIFEGVQGAGILAVLVSSIIFGIVHAYQGWTALLKITLLSMLFASIFILSGSLLVVIVLHYLVDFLGGVMAYSKNTGKDTKRDPAKQTSHY